MRSCVGCKPQGRRHVLQRNAGLMRKIEGGSERKNPKAAPRRQTCRIGRGEHLVDRAIPAPGDDAIDLACIGIGNRLGRHACSIACLPGDAAAVHAVTKSCRSA